MAAGAAQASPIGAAVGGLAAPSLVETASFWAQPYPYGYRWRKTPCIRYEPVCVPGPLPFVCETRWQPVRVCR